MTKRILSLRQLNRATLIRQMLLKRERLTIPAAIERLVGLQAQLSQAPFVGLWTRLHEFKREDLAHLVEDRIVVKATLMRATLHLVTSKDYVRFRKTLQPIMVRACDAIGKQRGKSFDLNVVLKVAREFIAEKPRTFVEISDHLARLFPGQDVGALRYSVRTQLPLVQVPRAGGWSYPNRPEFTLAENWIGRTLSSKDELRELVLRYLAAFGPASATDMQTWLGLKLKETFEKLRPELDIYLDEGRRELFDLPGMVDPQEDTVAPPRFLPEFDNLLLSHSNRTRVIAVEHRSSVYLPALRVAATFLIDGFVKGTWKVENTKNSATLWMSPFGPLTRKDRLMLAEEAEKLVRFISPESKLFEVRTTEA